LARQKLRRVAATKIAGVNGPLDSFNKVLQGGGRVLVQKRALGKEFHRPTYAQDFQKGWTLPGLHSTLRKGVHYIKILPGRG